MNELLSGPCQVERSPLLVVQIFAIEVRVTISCALQIVFRKNPSNVLLLLFGKAMNAARYYPTDSLINLIDKFSDGLI